MRVSLALGDSLSLSIARVLDIGGAPGSVATLGDLSALSITCTLGLGGAASSAATIQLEGSFQGIGMSTLAVEVGKSSVSFRIVWC